MARQSVQGRKPWGEPESLAELKPKRGRFPGRKDNRVPRHRCLKQQDGLQTQSWGLSEKKVCGGELKSFSSIFPVPIFTPHTRKKEIIYLALTVWQALF